MLKTKEELQTELDGLITKHGKGNVYTINTPLSQDDDCEYATIFLKKADRKQIEMINSVLRNNTDGLIAVEVAIKACYIGGDEKETVLNNEDALFGCDIPMFQFLQRKTGDLKKN